MTPQKYKPISARELFTMNCKHTYNTCLPSHTSCECFERTGCGSFNFISRMTLIRHSMFFFAWMFKWKCFYNITTIYILNIPTTTHLQVKNTKLLPSLLWLLPYSASGLLNVRNILDLLIFIVVTQTWHSPWNEKLAWKLLHPFPLFQQRIS